MEEQNTEMEKARKNIEKLKGKLEIILLVLKKGKFVVGVPQTSNMVEDLQVDFVDGQYHQNLTCSYHRG